MHQFIRTKFPISELIFPSASRKRVLFCPRDFFKYTQHKVRYCRATRMQGCSRLCNSDMIILKCLISRITFQHFTQNFARLFNRLGTAALEQGQFNPGKREVAQRFHDRHLLHLTYVTRKKKFYFRIYFINVM